MVTPRFINYAISRIYIEDFYSKTPGKDEDDYSGPFYWVLPDQFRGNKLTSYGYYLNYTIRFTEPKGYPAEATTQPDVILVARLEGKEKRLFWHAEILSAEKDIEHTYSARFFAPTSHDVDRPTEGKWTHDRDGHERGVSREDLMMVLQNLEDIMVRATYDVNMINTNLLKVELEYGTAESDKWVWPNHRATWVEKCNCPEGYTGTSCERCADGYDRVQRGPFLGECVRRGAGFGK